MKAKIQEDLKQAMKSRDQLVVNTLRLLAAEIKNAEIDTKAALTDDKVVAIVQREVKKRRDSIQFAEQAGRADTVEQCNQEIKILQGYLGDQLSEDQLKKMISELIAGGANDIGKVMGSLNKTHKGKFEGKMASEMVKQMLG